MQIKVRLLSVIFWCVRTEARFLKMYLNKRPSQKKRIAVLEPCPSSVGSNGDEALIEGTCRFLNEQPNTTVEILSFLDEYDGHLPVNTVYGGSLYCRSDRHFRRIIHYFAWPFLLARYDALYIIGADLIDGYYSKSVSIFLFFLLKTCDNLGGKGHLISCSFNDSSPQQVRQTAKKLLQNVRVHARDIYSANRLSEILGRPVRHSADVAFGLLPESSNNGQEIVRWIRVQEAAGRMVIALNINLLPITRQFAGRDAVYIRQWGTWLTEMTGKNYSFVFLPHDYRGKWSDEMAVIKLFNLVSPDVHCHCFLPKTRLHAGEIKYIVGHCQLTVTGRMHLAIASMGSGVPVIAYAYQKKFEGILRLFGIESCVRPIKNIFEHVGAEVIFAEQIAGNIEHWQEVVRANVDNVLTLARENIT